MPRRGIAVAVIVIVACFIVLGLTSDFLVDWAWFSAIGYLDVFGTILGGKAVLFFAVFAGSAILLWVNGSLASRFARRRGHVHPAGFGAVLRDHRTMIRVDKSLNGWTIVPNIVPGSPTFDHMLTCGT